MTNTLKYLIGILLMICLLPEAFAQSKYLGKRSTGNPEISCQQKLDSAQLIFDNDPEKALNLVEGALLLAIQYEFSEKEGEAYQLLGDFNYRLKQYNLSLKNYQKAIGIINQPHQSAPKKISSRSTSKSSSFESQSAPAIEYSIYKYAGLSAKEAGELDQSLDYFTLFLSGAQLQNNITDIIFGKTAIADVCVLQAKFNEAKQLYQQALQMEEERGNKKGIAEVNIRLGKLHQMQKQEDVAVDFYNKSKDVAIEIEDDEVVNEAFDNLSEVYTEKQDVPQQLEVSQEAMQYNSLRGNVKQQAKNSVDIGNIYINTDSTDKAIEHLERGVELSEEAGDIEIKSEAVKALSEAYEKEGAGNAALEKYKEYVRLEDSINSRYKTEMKSTDRKGRLLENTQNKLLVLQKDMELNEKTIELLRREKKLQEEQLRRQKLISWFMGAGLLLLLVTSFFVYRSNRARRRANRLLMLKSLRSQMNPHFIFNALNSVNNYISSNNERAANKYLADFSKLMRDVLENSSQDFIPLSKEIEILELYLKLEHSRFTEKFDYKFDVDTSIDREAYHIPPMLVQPYIENAVWHGLRYKKEKGYLHVFVKDKKEAVEISVIDNGIGRKRSQDVKTENQKKLESTGLKNISTRLQIIREVYKVKLQADINDLNPETGEGTVVTIILNKNSFENN